MSVYHFPAPLEREHLLSCLMRYAISQGRKEYVKVAKQVSTNVSKVDCNSYWRTIYRDALIQYLPKYHSQIAFDNTLLKVFSSFTQCDFSTLLTQQLEQPLKLQLKYANLEQVHHGWKWCPECVTEDEETYGVAYWHCDHQFALKKRCSQHGTLLISECQHCNYSFSSILQGAPPLSSCPKCGESFIQQDREDTDADLWIEGCANRILQDEFELNKTEVQEYFKAKYGFNELKRQWTLAERKHITYQQDLFGKWLDTLDLSNHLVPLSNNKPYSHLSAFNVSSYTFKNHNLAPMIHLLFKRYWLERLC